MARKSLETSPAWPKVTSSYNLDAAKGCRSSVLKFFFPFSKIFDDEQIQSPYKYQIVFFEGTSELMSTNVKSFFLSIFSILILTFLIGNEAYAFGGETVTVSAPETCSVTQINQLGVADCRNSIPIGVCKLYVKYDVRTGANISNYGKTNYVLYNSNAGTQSLIYNFYQSVSDSSNPDTVDLTLPLPNSTANEIETICSGATGSTSEIDVLSVSYSSLDSSGDAIDASSTPFSDAISTSVSVTYLDISSGVKYTYSASMSVTGGTSKTGPVALEVTNGTLTTASAPTSLSATSGDSEANVSFTPPHPIMAELPFLTMNTS